MDTAMLACPETGLPLTAMPLETAEETIGGHLRPRTNGGPEPVGPTETVLVCDRSRAYPVVDDIPVLLLPEVLLADPGSRAFDLREPRYAEAYEEMSFYNAVAAGHERLVRDGEYAALKTMSASARSLEAIAATVQARRSSFPWPEELWIDALYDTEAQLDAYAHIAPIEGQRTLQIGGGGSHAVKFLLAGASSSTLVGPMIGELRLARALAEHYGVEDRLHCVAGIAEELPFGDDVFDAIYVGACAHHWVTELAFPECARVLAEGGRFAAVDPWRSRGYTLGTKIFGKREPDVYCRPLDDVRIRSFADSFRQTTVVHHGALTRYPLVALGKLGVTPSLKTASRIQRTDDRLSSLVPRVRRAGSIVALLART